MAMSSFSVEARLSSMKKDRKGHVWNRTEEFETKQKRWRKNGPVDQGKDHGKVFI